MRRLVVLAVTVLVVAMASSAASRGGVGVVVASRRCSASPVHVGGRPVCRWTAPGYRCRRGRRWAGSSPCRWVGHVRRDGADPRTHGRDPDGRRLLRDRRAPRGDPGRQGAGHRRGRGDRDARSAVGPPNMPRPTSTWASASPRSEQGYVDPAGFLPSVAAASEPVSEPRRCPSRPRRWSRALLLPRHRRRKRRRPQPRKPRQGPDPVTISPPASASETGQAGTDRSAGGRAASGDAGCHVRPHQVSTPAPEPVRTELGATVSGERFLRRAGRSDAEPETRDRWSGGFHRLGRRPGARGASSAVSADRPASRPPVPWRFADRGGGSRAVRVGGEGCPLRPDADRAGWTVRQSVALSAIGLHPTRRSPPVRELAASRRWRQSPSHRAGPSVARRPCRWVVSPVAQPLRHVSWAARFAERESPNRSVVVRVCRAHPPPDDGGGRRQEDATARPYNR